MTDIMKLAGELGDQRIMARVGVSTAEDVRDAEDALKAAIEALQGECAELQSANDQLNDDCAMHMRVAVDAIDAKVVLMAERDALQAKLSALQTQEPVAWRCTNWSGSLDNYVYRDADDCAVNAKGEQCGEPLYAAPKAQEPLTDERIDELEDAAFRDYMEGRIDCYTYAVARAIESAHGIGSQQ